MPGKVTFASSGAGSSDHLTGSLNDTQNKTKMTDLGFDVVASTPAKFEKFLAQELARWKTVVDKGNISLE